MTGDLRFHLDSIQTGLERLRDFLKESEGKLSRSIVHKVTDFPRSSERYIPAEMDLTEILMVPGNSDEAVSKKWYDVLIEIYLDFYSPPEDEKVSEGMDKKSTKITRKYPGVVSIQCNQNEREILQKIIDDINSAKDAFRTGVQRLGGDHKKRFEELHKMFPGIISNAVTRQLTLLPNDTDRVYFNWQWPVVSSVKTVSELNDEIDKKLKKVLNEPLLTPEERIDFERNAEADKITIQQNAGEKCVVHRHSEFPVPIVTYKADRENKKTGKTERLSVKTTCSLPVFCTTELAFIKMLQATTEEQHTRKKQTDRRINVSPGKSPRRGDYYSSCLGVTIKNLL